MRRGLVSGQAVVCLLLVAAAAGGQEADRADLTPSHNRASTTRVRVHFNVGGDLLLPTQDGKKKRVPLSVVADLSYQERPSPTPEQAARGTGADGWKSFRYYDTAKATIKIGEGGMNITLPDDRRLIVATAEADSATLDRPTGPLTREELDLIDVPAGTHVLDRLLPGESKKTGDTWKHDQETMQVLLGLDQVSVCEVESVLVGMERGYARLRLAGSVHGTTDGAATELEVQAGYLFDTRLGRITRLNLAFAEKREEGRIGPAVDVVGKLSLEVDRLQTAAAPLRDEQLAALPIDDKSSQGLLLVEDPQTGLQLLHDRQWHVTSDERESMVLRRIDSGEFIAQCNITVRPERKEGRQSTLAEFEKDVRFSLGERFQSLVSSSEWTNAAGLRCFRLVVHGDVEGLPIEWRYYLAAPPAGRSVALSVSVEPRFVEQLGEADRALVESLQLLPESDADTKPATTAAQRPTNRQTE